ncbi:hypothetical protein ACFLVV_01700 [Chloroflexota bacterium]
MDAYRVLSVGHNLVTSLTKRMRLKRKSISAFTLWGALGFGIGGAIGGAIWVAFDAPHFGFAVLGAVGGASLGLVLKDRKTAGLLALAGAIGFGIGFLTGFFILLVIWQPIHMQGAFIGALGGAVGGASLGIASRSWKSVGVLALASAIGCGAVVQATLGHPVGLTAQILSGAITLAIWGAVGGASLGVAMGYLEKRMAGEEN